MEALGGCENECYSKVLYRYGIQGGTIFDQSAVQYAERT